MITCQWPTLGDPFNSFWLRLQLVSQVLYIMVENRIYWSIIGGLLTCVTIYPRVLILTFRALAWGALAWGTNTHAFRRGEERILLLPERKARESQARHALPACSRQALEHKHLTKASFWAHIIVHLMMHPCLTMVSDVSTEIGRPSCEDRVFLAEIAHMSLRR